MYINKDSARPVYLQIEDQIISAIDQGQLQPGDKVSSTRELCQQFGVSRMTVLQALRELTRQGRLFTVIGKGTFVGQPEKLETNLKTVWGFTETFRAEGYKTGSQLIQCAIVPASRDIAEQLEAAVDTPLYRLARKRMLNDQPVGIETAFLVQASCPGLEFFDWSIESLYSVLHNQYGLTPVCGCNYVEAAAADEPTARLLSIPKSSPVLATERTTCLLDRRPIEYVRAFYRADRMRLKVEMTSENLMSQLNSKIGKHRSVSQNPASG